MKLLSSIGAGAITLPIAQVLQIGSILVAVAGSFAILQTQVWELRRETDRRAPLVERFILAEQRIGTLERQISHEVASVDIRLGTTIQSEIRLVTAEITRLRDDLQQIRAVLVERQRAPLSLAPPPGRVQ